MLLIALILAAALSAPDAGAGRNSFRVVVHRSNPAVSITRAQLSAIYLRKTRSWPDGTEIVPVDQAADSRLREEFSRAVHGKSVAYVTRYWQRLIFSGRGIPPREVRSDREVLELVGSQRGAIGYVADAAEAGEAVRVVAVTP